MTIHLKPGLEHLIQKDVERGPYRSAEEYLERAVQLLHDQEEWLSEHKAEICAAIEDGYASAQRGELLDEDQVEAEMEAKKRSWRASRRPT